MTGAFGACGAGDVAPPLLRGWAPLEEGDPASVRERGSTYFPFERELRERWESWRRVWLRTPIGRSVPDDLIAVLREVPPPSGLFRAVGRRTVYRAYPIPARPVEGPWLVFQDREERPREGRCYRVLRPVRRVHRWTAEDGGPRLEEVVWSERFERISEAEFFPTLRVSPREAQRALRDLSDSTGLEGSTLPLLLLPFVGAPPWHGRPPGVDVVLGSWGVPTRVLSGATAPLRQLLPPWEVPGARVRGRRPRGSEDASFSSPYSVVIGPLGARAWERMEAKGSAFETSFLLYGGPEVSDLPRVLFDAHLPILDRPERWQELAVSRWEEERSALWADHLVRAHFRDPSLPEDDALHRGLEGALEKVRTALGEVPALLGLPQEEFQRLLLRSATLRDHLVQGALGHARVLGRDEMGVSDLNTVAARYVDAVADPALGRASTTRTMLSLGGRLRSKREQSRYFILRSVLMDRPDQQLDDLWARLRRKGLWTSREDLEDYLLRRSEEGVLAALRPGEYRWEGA